MPSASQSLKDRVVAERNSEARMSRGETELIGTVEHIVFFDCESGAVIARLRTGEAVRGKLGPEDDELERLGSYRFLGRWVDHYKYGRQFEFGTVLLHLANDRLAVVNYLKKTAQGCGVGPATAAKLWDHFGPEAVQILRTNPARVVAAGLLSEANALAAGEALAREAHLEQTKIELFSLFNGRGFPRSLVSACVEEWGAKAAERVRRNPFGLLVEGMPGCGFKRTDRLYLDLGFDPTATKRQMLAAWDAIRNDTDGSTWASKGIAVRAVRQAAPTGPKPEEAISLGVRSGWLAVRTDAHEKEWMAEGRKAQEELMLSQYVRNMLRPPTDHLIIWPTADELDPRLSLHQRDTVRPILGSRVAILAGTPGTGKSFVAAAVVKALINRIGPMLIAVCAPTGKASVRITSAMRRFGISALTANTIHRTLQITRNGHDGAGWGFAYNRKNPLPRAVVVVDEVSMLDTSLAEDLFAALGPTAHMLLIGDPYQLPPVGHGAPLRDMIAAGVPCGLLTEIKRQDGEANRIVQACAAIKDGKAFDVAPKFDPEAGDNLLFMEAGTAEQSVEALRSVLTRFKSSGKFDPAWETQVLVALNEKSPVSRAELNKLLQGMLNPPTEEDRPSQQKYRVGDKVICLKNCWLNAVRLAKDRDYPEAARLVKNYEDVKDYGWAAGGDGGDTEADPGGDFPEVRPGAGPKQVYLANGEIGRVLAAEPKVLVAKFSDPDRTVRIPFGSQKKDGEGDSGGSEQGAGQAPSTPDGDKAGGGTDFDLGYAITTHKSQGSEWRCVIVMVDEAAGFVASREHIYTSISRASELCIMIGRRGIADRQVRKVNLHRRKTFLAELLKEAEGASL